jgi:predicted ATP-dependent endonuclease of OLD family
MNYRCFGSEEQVILIDDLTTFIGNNSAGKTAALAALNCMFSEKQ